MMHHQEQCLLLHVIGCNMEDVTTILVTLKEDVMQLTRCKLIGEYVLFLSKLKSCFVVALKRAS